MLLVNLAIIKIICSWRANKPEHEVHVINYAIECRIVGSAKTKLLKQVMGTLCSNMFIIKCL